MYTLFPFICGIGIGLLFKKISNSTIEKRNANETRIELKLLEQSCTFAGNNFGEFIYNTQVKDKINFKGINTIVIPDCVKYITISFVQGFTADIIKRNGIGNFHKHFIIEGNETVVNKFNHSILF